MKEPNDLHRPIAHLLSMVLLSACGTTTDVQTNSSNRDIAFEETL